VPARAAAILGTIVAAVALTMGASGASTTTTSPSGASVGSAASVANGSSGRSTASGVEHLHFKYGPLDIAPGQNIIQTSGFDIPQPAVDGWVVGIKPNLRESNGTVPPVDVIHLHHGVWLNATRLDSTARLPERFLAAGEEKTALQLPAGFGYPYRTTDRWILNYMIHDLTARRFELWITYDIDFIPSTSPAAAGIRAVRPIWLDVQNGSLYPVFDVIKGSGDGKTFTYPDQATDPYGGGPAKNQWTADRDGVLVETFGHLHPGGLHDDIYLERAGAGAAPGSAASKSVKGDVAHLFSSKAHYFEPAGAVSWDVAMTATPDSWRVAVHQGDVLSITTTYDSKRASWYESMGLAIVWMADGNDGANPFSTSVDQAGHLTHGHLAENNNHGGKPTSFADPRKVTNGSDTSTVDISKFIFGSADLSQGKGVPVVKQGSTITFDNLDAPAQGIGIWHSITACRAPCTASTGVAYPLADATVSFDSGQLGNDGPPTVGRDSWQVPTDLQPGTYTFFCRVHPFMRGAFRVVPPA
jgi:hypothetical protein